MALTPETGAALANADCVISLADFKAYADARGRDYSDSTDGEIEIGIRVGWQYIENAYRSRWKGARYTRAQALAWPRIGSPVVGLVSELGLVQDEDGWYIQADEIPRQVKYANAEAALLVLQGVDLEPRLARGGAIKRKRVKAAVVETETEYSDAAPARDRLTVIEGLLAGLVTSAPGAGFGSVEIVRG